MTYMICDRDGYALTDGLQEHDAHRTAQRIADDRGEAVYLSTGEEEAETIHPQLIVVVVNDGQYRWGADRAELLEALYAQGWTRSGRRFVEPPRGDPGDCASTGAYTELCGDVQPVPGYGPEDQFNDDGLAAFAFQPSLGAGVWTLTE